MSAVKHNIIKLTDTKIVTSDIAMRTQIFTPLNLTTNFLGVSFCISSSDNFLVVGVPTENTVSTNTGAVYFYNKSASDTWMELQKLQASDKQASDFYGQSVTINAAGNTAVVGAPFEDTGFSNAGSAYILTKNASDIWSEKQKIQSSDRISGGNFGLAVTINAAGNMAMIGHPNYNSGGGSVNSFKKDSSDIWSQVQLVLAGDGASSDSLGYSIALNAVGDVMLVGAPGQDTGGTHAGSVYFYKKNTSDLWTEMQQFQASDLASNDRFGTSLSMNDSGDTAIVGVPLNDGGAAYIFTKNTSDIWSEKQKLVANNTAIGDEFGNSVSINGAGNIAIVGAHLDDIPLNTDNGSVYIFAKNSSEIWYQQSNPIVSDFGSINQFGVTCAINNTGNKFIVGAVIFNGSTGAICNFTNKLFAPISYYQLSDVSMNEVYFRESDSALRILMPWMYT